MKVIGIAGTLTETAAIWFSLILPITETETKPRQLTVTNDEKNYTH
jgi:hypothetical protein